MDNSRNCNIFATLTKVYRSAICTKGPDGGIGRRVGLKHQCPKGCAGSTPAPGTKRKEADFVTFFSFSFLHHSCTTDNGFYSTTPPLTVLLFILDCTIGIVAKAISQASDSRRRLRLTSFFRLEPEFFLQPAPDEIRAQHKRLSGPVFVGCHSGLGLEEFVE